MLARACMIYCLLSAGRHLENGTFWDNPVFGVLVIALSIFFVRDPYDRWKRK